MGFPYLRNPCFRNSHLRNPCFRNSHLRNPCFRNSQLRKFSRIHGIRHPLIRQPLDSPQNNTCHLRSRQKGSFRNFWHSILFLLLLFLLFLVFHSSAINRAHLKGGNRKGGSRTCFPVHCLSARPDRQPYCHTNAASPPRTLDQNGQVEHSK